MFLEAYVCRSVHREEVCLQGGFASGVGGSASSGGVCLQGVCLLRGVCLGGSVSGVSTSRGSAHPQYCHLVAATAVVGTHPTGMHS